VRGLLEAGAFGLLPLVGPAVLIAYVAGVYRPHGGKVAGVYSGDGGLLFDLHVLWKAGHHLVTGHSPYPFVYPAPAAFLMAPFGALPWKVAVLVFAAVLIAAMILALRLLGVRDWRCYGAALASVPLMSSLTIGTLSPLLVLAAAAAWKYRDRRFVVAAAIVGAVVTKIFLWPLVIWLIATRRLRTAVTTVLLGIAAVVVAWAAIGFDGFLQYPHRLTHIADLEQAKSYSVFALLQALGLGSGTARLGVLALGVAMLGLVVLAARGADGDRRSFVLAIAAALVISPIVWIHYLVLVFVPVALYRRRLSVAWILPLAYWYGFGQESGGSVAVICAGLGLAAAAVAAAVVGPRLRRSASLGGAELEPVAP
jgi:hypothetical protein